MVSHLGSATSATLRTHLDSGVPENSTDYTTIIIIHGYVFHAGHFKKLLPLAHAHNARVVAINRRDYPGSAPFTPEERANLTALASATPRSADAVTGTAQEMKLRARELYDYLVDFVRTERVPRPQGINKGGIVLVGWSLGVTWITALLAHAAEFPVDDVRVSEYLSRLVIYEGSFNCFGYPMPEDMYHPLHDPSITPEARLEFFFSWATGYYTHGELAEAGATALEPRTAQTDPPPTVQNMTAEDMAESTYPPAAQTGGGEALLLRACMVHGTYASLKEGALYPVGNDGWRSVELRFVWCDRSIWEMPWGAFLLSGEVAEAKKAGRAVRDVAFVRFRGANHFAHWDFPEKTLRAWLGDDTEIA